MSYFSKWIEFQQVILFQQVNRISSAEFTWMCITLFSDISSIFELMMYTNTVGSFSRALKMMEKLEFESPWKVNVEIDLVIMKLYAVPVRHICSTCEAHLQYLWGIFAALVRIWSICEGNFIHFSFKQRWSLIFSKTVLPAWWRGWFASTYIF